MAQALPLLVALIAGVAMAVQAPTNGFLGRTAGSWLLASLINFGIGLLALVAATLILRPRPPPGWIEATPWWAWLGGVYGAVIVFAAAWATPRLGAGTAMVMTVSALAAGGVLLDHFGAFGLRGHPVSGLRAAGVLAVVAGALMVQRG
jgi:transporter family-2 protein